LNINSNGGEIVASFLHEKGTEYIFTLCGGHISPILIGANNVGIRVIDVRHEATAVFAADAITRLSDKPGISTVTAGPGLTNTITAVKNAQMAQSPVILIGGATATILKNKGSLQDIDQIALMSPHVKWACSVKRICQIEKALDKCFNIAYDGVTGPVFIEIPVDLLYPEKIVREWYGLSSENNKQRVKQFYLNWHVKKLFNKKKFEFKPYFSSTSVSPKKYEVNNCIKMIRRANKPILLVSSQALLLAKNALHLKDAIMKIGLPTYLSGTARGLLGNYQNFFLHNRSKALKQADLIILAGAPLDFRLAYGRKIPQNTSIISINRCIHNLNLNRRPTLAVHADPCQTILKIAKSWSYKNDNWKRWKKNLKTHEIYREKQIVDISNLKTKKINSIALLMELKKIIKDDSIIIVDGGDFAASASYILKPRQPLSWLDPGPFGTLGVGAGFAIGAKLSKPDSDIWILYGDGSVGYSLTEFDTFYRHNLSVIGLVGNDAGWTQIKREQINIFKDDLATTLLNTNYHIAAEAYGGKGHLLNSLDNFGEIIKKLLLISNSGQPVLINAIIEETNFRKGSISI
tara:strand:+ start:7093 stop:8820 length:1728 start_codon:yes stop_codon:yes gene_type:complete